MSSACAPAVARVATELRRLRRLRGAWPLAGHTLTAASNLAGNLWWLGEYQRARTLDEDTLTRRCRVLGEDHPDTLATASQLANDLFGLGNYPSPGNCRKRR